MPKLDKSDPTPLYFKLKKAIETRIADGEFPVGSQLPTEPEWCDAYEVSQITVRKALNLMAQEGVVERRQGKGSFVQKLPRQAVHAPGIARPVQLNLCMVEPFLPILKYPETRRLWSKAFPNVDVNLVAKYDPGTEDFRAPLEGMDVFVLSEYELRECRASGFIQPLSDINPRGWNDRITDLLPGLREVLGEAALQYMFPIVAAPLALFYNRQHFREASVEEPSKDWSFQEFIGAGCRLRDHFEGESAQRTFPFLAELSDRRRWPLFLYLQGGRLWSGDGSRSTIGSNECIEGVQLYRELISNYRISQNIFSASYNLEKHLFLRQAVSMHFGTYVALGAYEKEGAFEWGVAPIPAGTHPATMLVQGGMAVSSQTTNPGLAWEFIEFMHSPEIQRIFLDEGRHIPTSRAAVESWKEAADSRRVRNLDVMLDAIPAAAPLEYPVRYNAQRKLEERVQHLWLELPRAAEICRSIEEELNRFLQESRSDG